MRTRLTIVGIVLTVVGVGFAAAGGYTYLRVEEGSDSLRAVSRALNITIPYDEHGNLTDRGQTESADAILRLLRDDWRYPVDESALDPNDPIVNTATEYAYQVAAIVQRTGDSVVQVTLDVPVEYRGEVFEPGTYSVPIAGRYWTELDPTHPLEGPASELAWTGTVRGVMGEMGTGSVAHSTLQIGFGLAALLVGLGLAFVVAGGGVFWIARSKELADGFALTTTVPDTVPQELLDEHHHNRRTTRADVERRRRDVSERTPHHF